MATYKDTEEILHKIYNLANKSTLGETTISYLDWKDVVYLIKEAPCVDMIEVVRCKDCKYYEIHKPSVTLNCERYGLLPMLPTDFCSYGERKEEQDE